MEELYTVSKNKFRLILGIRELTQWKPLEFKTRHNRIASSTLCWKPHLNNNPNKNTNPIFSTGSPPQPCPSEEKQKTNKNSVQMSPYMKLTQTTEPNLGEQKPKQERFQP